MFRDLLTIKNYKLFLINMIILGMALAITVPFFVLYATQELGMTRGMYGVMMALFALAGFMMNTIVARFSDRPNFNRKRMIIFAVLMASIAFSTYFYIDNPILFIMIYVFFGGMAAPAMPQLYASARESINVSASSKNAVFANTLLRSMFSFGFLFGPLVGTILLKKFGFAGIFGGTIALYVVVLLSFLFFYEDIKVEKPAYNKGHIEPVAPNLMKDMYLLIPFLAFVFLHIGQWMYTLNMPLFVTEYLKDDEANVGYLASLCAGLEVPFMIILGMLASRFQTRTLLMIGAVFGGGYYFSIGVFDDVTAMLIGQICLAFFLAILLGLGISYFQDILPDFPGYASTLFSNAMIAGQLLGNLLGGVMSDIVGLGNVFFVSSAFVLIAFVLLIFTKPVKMEDIV
ncbi:sugar efflux transporter [Macrococcus armenti]|uniref:sugar efflux transporter n=1 Tax=Macrococcus armenti TaxID=2875764 RepID=UPI001CCED661|nr:sugar efflux transporter [Macrococcus armenti]UBH11386.1 sugar efflux transporter [Macrococcus armenti]UBH15872.1 sugar efflux transporter [Macrococcus armenti]UBH18232.1 sugar efflux transporter [Macrococcus armenti]UBH20498.1 sugar efflux transporter [Macrococcus armenti]